MLLLSMLACLDASADQPVRWEYATVDVSNPACVAIEANGTLAMPYSPAPHGSPKDFAPCVDRVFSHPMAALTYFGDQGWEVVDADGYRYLVKRPH